jgi:alcohol dehydrogenase class IV
VVEQFNREAAVERFAAIAQAMGVDTSTLSTEEASKAALDAIRKLSQRVGIPASFKEFGIKASDIEAWIQPALNDPCTPGNPRALSADDVRKLYKAVL